MFHACGPLMTASPLLSPRSSPGASPQLSAASSFTFRRARERAERGSDTDTHTAHTLHVSESPKRYLTAVASTLSTTFKGSLAVSQHTQKQTSPSRYQTSVNNAQRRDISDVSLLLLAATHAAMTVVALYPRISALPIDHPAKGT